jgi:hypothetical protein
MNKDLKIAIVVIAIILMIIIFGDSNTKTLSSSGHNYKNTHQSNNTKSTAKSIKASSEKSCYHNGIELKGNVQFVDSFPDLKIKYVSSFADINVEFVSSFPDDCGQWKEVTSFPDFKVQVVDSFPDIEVKKVSSFPGMQ